MVKTEDPEVKEKILEILKGNDAVVIATTGGENSPWILGAYFASEDLKIFVLLETNGKSISNIKINKNVAISISRNDAMQDFIQASAEAVILNEEKESEVREKIEAKMPWFKTYTPVTPVRLDVKRFYVSSLQKGWFPAKEFES